jgi:hypothetical protein
VKYKRRLEAVRILAFVNGFFYDFPGIQEEREKG